MMESEKIEEIPFKKAELNIEEKPLKTAKQELDNLAKMKTPSEDCKAGLCKVLKALSNFTDEKLAKKAKSKDKQKIKDWCDKNKKNVYSYFKTHYNLGLESSPMEMIQFLFVTQKLSRVISDWPWHRINKTCSHLLGIATEECAKTKILGANTNGQELTKEQKKSIEKQISVEKKGLEKQMDKMIKGLNNNANLQTEVAKTEGSFFKKILNKLRKMLGLKPKKQPKKLSKDDLDKILSGEQLNAESSNLDLESISTSSSSSSGDSNIIYE